MSFVPVRLPIINITQSNPAVVTTGQNHNLVTGQVVRVHVPQGSGMNQLNNQLLSITVLSLNSFSLQYSQVPPGDPVNSINYEPFVLNPNSRFTAEILPVGSGPTPITNFEWQARNNFCESRSDDALRNVATVNQPY